MNWFQIIFVIVVVVFWVFFGLDLGKKRRKSRDKDHLSIFYSRASFPIVNPVLGNVILLVLAGLCAIAVSVSLFELVVMRHDIDTGGFVLLALAPQLAYSVLPINKITIGSDFLEADGVRYELAIVFVRLEDSFLVITAKGILGEVAKVPDRYVGPGVLEEIQDRLDASRKAR